MESISHAESAAGLSDWKASGLLLLLVDFFSYYLFTPGFEIFSLFKRGNRFVRLSCLQECARGGKGLTPPPFGGSGGAAFSHSAHRVWQRFMWEHKLMPMAQRVPLLKKRLLSTMAPFYILHGGARA